MKLETYGYIYLMHSDNGYYKIGRTTDPRARLSSLSFGPTAINLHNLIYCPDYTTKEKYLHLFFETKRVRGEWFNLSSKDLEKVYILFDEWNILETIARKWLIAYIIKDSPRAKKLKSTLVKSLRKLSEEEIFQLLISQNIKDIPISTGPIINQFPLNQGIYEPYQNNTSEEMDSSLNYLINNINIGICRIINPLPLNPYFI